MEISLNLKKSIVDEFRSIAKKMGEEKELSRKMYFFSAAYGIVNRAYNLEFNEDLLLLHLVLYTSYGTINSRVAAMAQGVDPAVRIPDEVCVKLQKNMEDLANAIDKGENIYELLKTMAKMSYIATGNGFYLWEKGILKI